MRRREAITIRFVLLSFGLLVAACDSVGAKVAYQPLGVPLKISINSWGEIDIEASGEIVTPIGVFEVGLVTDPARFFDGVQNTLVVRIGSQECWYDLNGQDFNVELAPGYYQQIALRKEQSNICLELQGEETAVSGCSQKPIRTAARLQPAQQIVCEGALPSHLAVGKEATISVFQAAVHQEPGESTPLVRNKFLARDQIVTIVEGPVCAERVLFWKVRSQEIDFAGGGRGVIVGWVAEESGDIYLLKPR